MKRSIAFYAPLKSPRHPNPSGDRQIARLFIKALSQAGFEVELASQFRSLDKRGCDTRQARMINIAKRLADRLVKRWQRQGYKPDAWFTYHLYYKAPDLIGPRVCEQLGIPYIAAEASWASKREHGPWQRYNRQLKAALNKADRLICINPVDLPALAQFNPERSWRLEQLPAFIELQPATAERSNIAKDYQLDASLPWLICVAMMRDDAKWQSYQQLAKALGQSEKAFELLIVGDGVKRCDVAELFADDARVKLLGLWSSEQLPKLLACGDIFIWPAVNEALGLSFLEAQAQGMAVVSARHGGVHSVVTNGHTGTLVRKDNPSKLAKALDQLLDEPERLARYQRQASEYVARNHSLDAASRQLACWLEVLLKESQP